MCISPSYTIPANVPSYIRNGIPNHYIFTEISDPMNEDTDGDGLTDKQDVEIGTDPINADTDYDTILDGNDVKPFDCYETKKVSNWLSVDYSIDLKNFYLKQKFVNHMTFTELNHWDMVQRNYKHNIDIENTASFNIIKDQNSSPVCDMIYGMSRFKDVGCELIGIYNGLKKKSVNVSLSEIACDLEMNHGMDMDLKLLNTHPEWSWVPSCPPIIGFSTGYFGTNPFTIEKYLDVHNYKNEQTNSLSELDSWIKPGRVFIISYWNSKDSIKDHLHTIAAITNSSGGIDTYNNGRYNNFQSFTDLINQEKGAFITGYYLY